MGEIKARAFFRHEGKDYYDWTLHFVRDRYRHHPENVVAIEKTLLGSLYKDNIDKLLDDKFVPVIGSKIHVAPNCPVGMADIRRNYVIKRDVDNGCCNVFSPHGGSYTYMPTEYVAIIPTRKSVVVRDDDLWPKNDRVSIERLRNDVEAIFGLDASERAQMKIVTDLRFRLANVSEDQLMLLFGKLKKPCISYKKLLFKTENELTLDMLYLVYRTGIAPSTKDNEEKFKIQLCALNEHNWRDYPGTINILFQNVLRRRGCAELLGASSRIPKAAQEMVRQLSVAEVQFKSKSDIEMAQQMLMQLMDMKDVRYTTIDTILNKFKEKRIETEALYRCFDNMVRLTPKQFKNETES